MKTDNKHPANIIWWILLLILFGIISGCGSSSRWYKTGHSQTDFDLDSRECAMIAQEIGREATILGEKVDMNEFTKAYTNCLFNRGWSHTNPDALKQKHIKPVELAKVEGRNVNVFETRFSLPAGFQLIRNQIVGIQDVQMQTLSFKGPGPVYMNMIIQNAVSRQFDRIDYPAQAPFFIYEKGVFGTKRLPGDWTVFSGDFKGDWVAGIGAYYLFDGTRRISVVMTKAISPPQEDPPKGLKLTKIQKTEVDALVEQWLEPVILSLIQ